MYHQWLSLITYFGAIFISYQRDVLWRHSAGARCCSSVFCDVYFHFVKSLRKTLMLSLTAVVYYLLFDMFFVCAACNCSVLGSLSSQCDDVTGVCVCRTNVTGEKCDVCMTEHYGHFTGEIFHHSQRHYHQHLHPSLSSSLLSSSRLRHRRRRTSSSRRRRVVIASS